MKQSNTFKRLGAGLVLTAFLVCCFLGTSFSLRPAYAWENAPILSMNGGAPVIDTGADGIVLEPGMKIQKKFKIQNLTGTVNGDEAKAYHYGFYFQQGSEEDGYEPLSGELANVLQISILDKEQNILITDTMASMHIRNIKAAMSNHSEDIISARETKELILQIYYPSTVGNIGMGDKIENFEFCLAFDTVQSNTL